VVHLLHYNIDFLAIHPLHSFHSFVYASPLFKISSIHKKYFIVDQNSN
jgi:hypothetical protein